MTSRMQRLVALGGLAFVVLVLASVFAIPEPPQSDASSAKTVTFYHAHKAAAYVSVYLVLVAIFVALFFFWYLRDFLAVTPAAKRLATIGFAGALLFAASGAASAGALYAIAQAIDHADPATIQTLNIVAGSFSSGLGAAGVAVFLIATNVAVIRGNGRLPVWLGWVGIVLGVASIVLIDPGIIAMGLWLLITCITMLVRVQAPSTSVGIEDVPSAPGAEELLPESGAPIGPQ
jgi:hypothetical protein